jgi:hypothetical protein
MANEEHLKILKQGVEVWNQWREKHSHISPDLSKADLRGTKLGKADLHEANLHRADLRGTILSRVDLRGANLRGAKLNRADLSEALLSKAHLSGVDLVETNLRGADLFRANLRGANLYRANLRGANLCKAYFREADLYRADLSQANLQNANLEITRLMNANLDGANLTNAQLWEAQRAGWSIKGIICESVYWYEEAKEKTVYTPGEFERLFAEQTKIKLIYKAGISPLEIATLPALIQHLEERKDCSLRFVSITEGAGGAVVELAIENTEELSQKKIESLARSIKESAERDIQTLRHALKNKEDEVNLLNGKVEGLKESMTLILQRGRGDTYIFNKSQIAAAGRNALAKSNALNSVKKTRQKS